MKERQLWRFILLTALLFVTLTACGGTGGRSLILDSVNISDSGSGQTSVLAIAGVDAPVAIRDTTIIGKNQQAFFAAPALSISNSLVETGAAAFVSHNEPLGMRSAYVAVNGLTNAAVCLISGLGFELERADVLSATSIELVTSPGSEPIFSEALQGTTVVKDSSFTVLAGPGGLNRDPVFTSTLCLQQATFDNTTFDIAGSAAFGPLLGSEIIFANSVFILGDAKFPDDVANLSFGNGGTTGLLGINNSAISFESTGALQIELDDSSRGFVSGEIQGNVFDFDINAPGAAAVLYGVDPAIAFFDASNNVWGDHTVTADVEALIDYTGTSDPSTFKVAPITPAP